MSPNKTQLIKRIAELVQDSAELRTRLQDYENTMVLISRRLKQDKPAVDASHDTAIPGQRQQVTAAIENFEAARHQLRVALFAVGREEGASISEVGRILGISRQLASRIAMESVAEAS